MFHQIRGRKSRRKEVKLEAAKVMKPRSELNPGVWQGDCFLGIDQNRSKMFRRPGMQMLVLWRADSHCPEDRAEIPHPAIGAPRFSDAARNRRPQSPVQGETATVPSGSGSRGVREMLLDAETRRRGETRGEHLSGLASELARLRRKVKTCERGDSGDRTASQRGSRWGGRLTNAARGGYRNAV